MMQLIVDTKVIQFTWVRKGGPYFCRVEEPVSVEMPTPEYFTYVQKNGRRITVKNTWDYCVTTKNGD